MLHRIEEIAERLLLHTGYPLTAVVSLDENGMMIDICLFDTYWQSDSMCVAPAASEIWLISHHPEGGKMPYNEDLYSMERVKAMVDGAQIRFFLVSEYDGCMALSV
ncbi:MAG: hypothetical protein IJB85_08635 [Clostridia bacterium]|nr:hypothetical protein [Clostridia bacterium]